MCTCITYENGGFYFGRNMDLECSFGEKVVITPRKFVFPFRSEPEVDSHYAMIGMANVMNHYPLYAEAVNEKGLCMAGLNFPGNAVYREEVKGKKNIAPFELILWLLGTCASVPEAKDMLREVNITAFPFAEHVPLSPLHWMLADRKECVVIETTEEGLKIHDNPYGVLTNNPPFSYHRWNLCNYLNLERNYPENRFSDKLPLRPYGQGMGAVGLPGDSSPASRFVRAAFLRSNTVCGKDELSNVSQFFHILDGVSMVRGCVRTKEGKYDLTTYACCVNVKNGIYYCRTYENSQIQAVDLNAEDLETSELISYELEKRQKINWHNR